jgi:transposase
VEELSDEYGLTPEGLVYSYVSHALLSPQTKGKYPKVKITHQGKTYNFLLHRLLALAFIPNPSSHTVVRHLDDNPRNYSLSNLAWGEVEHNTADAIANGILSGTVLTGQQPRELIAQVDSGELTQMEAANMYNVPFQSVSRWMLGQSRKESTGRAEVSPGMRCGEKHPAATLSSEQLRELVAMLQSGNYTQRDLAKQFRVSTACVSRIKNGKTRSTETGLAGNGERA